MNKKNQKKWRKFLRLMARAIGLKDFNLGENKKENGETVYVTIMGEGIIELEIYQKSVTPIYLCAELVEGKTGVLELTFGGEGGEYKKLLDKIIKESERFCSQSGWKFKLFKLFEDDDLELDYSKVEKIKL